MWSLEDYYENSHTPLNSLRKTWSVIRQTDRQKWSKHRRWLGGSGRANRQPTDPIRVCGTAQLTQERAQGAVTHCWSTAGRDRGRQSPALLTAWPVLFARVCEAGSSTQLHPFILSETSSPLEHPPSSSCKQTPAPLHPTGSTKEIKSGAGNLALGLLFSLNMPFSFCLSFFFFFFNNDRIFRTGDTTK